MTRERIDGGFNDYRVNDYRVFQSWKSVAVAVVAIVALVIVIVSALLLDEHDGTRTVRIEMVVEHSWDQDAFPCDEDEYLGFRRGDTEGVSCQHVDTIVSEAEESAG